MNSTDASQLSIHQTSEQFALRWGIYGTVYAGLITLIFLLTARIRTLPIESEMSITTIGAALVLVSSIWVYGKTYQQSFRRMIADQQALAISKFALWRDTICLSIAHGLILTTVSFIVGYFFSVGFKGLHLDIFAASVIIGLEVGLSIYLTINLASSVDPDKLIGMLAVVLIGGTFFSMAMNSNRDWWRVNFSSLGSHTSSYATVFNLTLILSAFIMMALASSIFRLLEQAISNDKNAKKMIRIGILKTLFISLAIALGGVGFFPYEEGTILATLHNLAAFALTYLFLILIILMRWLAAGFSREFFTISYVVGLSLIISYVLYLSTGYLSLTAFEFLSFGMCFAWLILFLRQISLFSNGKVT